MTPRRATILRATSSRLELGEALRQAESHPMRPVFVGGCPRSGTTLLGAMLGIGSARLTVPEAMFKFRWVGCDGAEHLDLQRELAALRDDERYGLWGVPLEPDEDVRGDVSPRTLLSALVLSFGLASSKPAPSVWIDHTPGNIRNVARLAATFPDARFVNLVRDGRAVANSVLPLDWGPNTVWEAGPWWATHVAHGLAAERCLPGRVRTVKFEDLVRDPTGVLRDLCAFLGMEFSPAMLAQRDYPAATYSVTDHRLVDQPVDPGRVEAWRSGLSPGQISDFEYRTGDLLCLLGYPMVDGGHARPRPRHLRLQSFGEDVLRRAVLDRIRRRLPRGRGDGG